MMSERDTRARTTQPLQIVNAAFAWAGEGETEATAEQDLSAAQARKAAEDQVDRAFLERIYGAHQDGRVETFSSSWHFTPQDHARAVKIVTAHPAVTPFLQGRWGVLGVDQAWTRPSGSAIRPAVHVHLFNYTANRLLDIRLENDQVTSVDERDIHEYPEAPHEMATAIDLARSHPDLNEAVRDLDGHAILSVPADTREPSLVRRCMWVMFTDRNEPTRELPTLYAALVDLGAMEVIACGPTPSTEQADDDHVGTRS